MVTTMICTPLDSSGLREHHANLSGVNLMPLAGNNGIWNWHIKFQKHKKSTFFTTFFLLNPSKWPSKHKNRSLLTFRTIEMDWCVVRRRAMTPFISGDTLGPRQVPKHKHRCTISTRKFFLAPQLRTSCLVRYPFWVKSHHFDGYPSKINKNRHQLAFVPLKHVF